jgi:DNA recombination protein RmuC
MSLIGLLKSVAFSWKQEAMSINAKAISEQGEEVYKALKTFFDHFEKLGKSISNSVVNYNQLLSSFESRLVPKTKKLQGLLGHDEVLEEIAAIEKVVKVVANEG